MSQAESLLALQDAIANRLAADTWMTPPAAPAVRVVTERLGDLQSQIDGAIASIGICAAVMTPSGKLAPGSSDQAANIVLDPTDVIIQVTENPITNRTAGIGTGKTALEVVIRVMRLIQGFVPDGRVGSRKLAQVKLREDDPFRLIQSDAEVIYHVKARARVNLGAPITIVSVLGEDGVGLAGEDSVAVHGAAQT